MPTSKEAAVEEHELSGEESNGVDNSLDAIIVRVGQLGRFQIVNYLLLCVPMIFNSFFSISYVFTAGTLVYRCNVTYCDSATSAYMEPWVDFTIPKKRTDYDQCSRYVTLNSSALTSYSEPSSDFCIAANFHQTSTERCGHDFKFHNPAEQTISNEFGIFCGDEWKLAMVGTINNIGQFVGIPLGGFFADRFGRRTALAVAGTLSSIMGIIRSLSVNYYMFCAFEFLDNALGSTLFPTAFLMAVEWVGPQRRVVAGIFICVFYAFGEATLGALAETFPNWRILLRVLYIPAVLQILFLCILPESVRWLLGQGKEERAKKTIRLMAKWNKSDIPEESLDKLIQENREKLATANESSFPIVKSFRLFHWRILNCCFCWFTHTIVALGLSLTSVTLGGNKYTNFILNGVIQVPGIILPIFIMDRLGRRLTLCGSMVSCAVCMFITAIAQTHDYTIELVLFLIGKFAITCSFQILYFFTSEIFPTNVRNSLLSICSMIGRIGSMIAPQVPQLTKSYPYAPQIIFGTFSLVSGCLTLLFPETANKVLPTTVEDAKNLSSKTRK